MKSRAPIALCCLFLLLITLPALSACTRKGPTDPPLPTEDAGSVAAKADDLIGSWMLLSGDRMEVYTFRRGGEITIFEMESATVVRSRITGSYSLTGDRLTIEIGGGRESYTVLTDSGRALILNGQILTPVAEPEN